MDYGEILSKAWHTIWKHKILWLFGFLAGCGSGGGGRGNFNLRTDSSSAPPQVQHFFNQLQPWQITLLIIAAVIFVLVLVLLSIASSAIGISGITKGTLLAAGREEPLSFREVWAAAIPYLLKVAGLDLLLVLIVLLFVTLGAIVAISFTAITFGLGLLCIIPLICVLGIVLWAFGIAIIQTYQALIVEDLSIRAAISRGFQVFSDNLAEMLIMGLVLGFGGGLVRLLIGAPILIALLPAVTAFINDGTLEAVRTSLLPGLLCLVPYLPVYLLANSIIASYIYSAWTLTYTTLIGYPANTPQAAPESLPEGF